MRMLLYLLVIVCAGELCATEAYTDAEGTYVNGISNNSNAKGGRSGKYTCYSSRNVDMLVIYPYEAKKSIEWETSSYTAGKGKTYIDIPMGFGTGWIRPSMKADYDLIVDGKKLVTFGVTNDNKKVWKGVDGVTLTYYALHRDAVGEPHGRMLLELPAGFKRTETYLSMKVAPSKGSAGNAWLMIHHGALYAGNDIAKWISRRNFK